MFRLLLKMEDQELKDIKKEIEKLKKKAKRQKWVNLWLLLRR